MLAAAISPWLYLGGKNLGMAAATRELPQVLEWLGAACARSDFSRFFSRALVIAAVLLLPFLLYRVRAARALVRGKCDPCVHLTWRCALVQVGVGWLIAAGLLWAAGMALAAQGAYAPKPDPVGWGHVFGKVIGPAVAVPLVEEWLFRGLLLGLWLRFARPLAACVGTSLFFAFIHFLKLPDGAVIADPGSALAGFELLGKILFHFTEPLFFVADFAALFAVGMILCQARLKTGALWFSMGLHAGWIMAFKGFNLRYASVSAHPLHPWGVGDTLRSGLFPMLTLGLTAVVCHFILERLGKCRVDS